MAGVRNSKIGDFAFDPTVRIFALDVGANGGDEGADGPDTTLGRAELEAELVGHGHGFSVLTVQFTLAHKWIVGSMKVIDSAFWLRRRNA
jgi:hypothetical protein